MTAFLTRSVERLKHAERMRWLWRLLGYPVGFYFALRYWVNRYTSRVEVRGEGAAFRGPAVYVHWHRYVPFMIGHHGERRRWIMTSPAPYMEPAVSACRLLGLRIVRGATGMDGRGALGTLRQALEQGDSVVLAVDGPAGPGFQVKRGCADLARAVRVPVIPVSYSTRHGSENAHRWDRMLHPRPFDRIVVEYGEPIDVSAESMPELLKHIRRALDALDAGRAAPLDRGFS